jgi:hypothetical protein
LKHASAKESHPGRSIGLIERPTTGQRLTAVEDTNVIQSKEPATENVLSSRVFPVDPPRKIQEQLLKGTSQKLLVAA